MRLSRTKSKNLSQSIVSTTTIIPSVQRVAIADTCLPLCVKIGDTQAALQSNHQIYE